MWSIGRRGGESEPVSASARQHLVDTDDVVRVDADPHVEAVLTTELGDVLVARDTGSLKSLRRDLLVLPGEQVGNEGELIHAGLLPAEIVDPDLRLRYTAAVAGLDVRLVLAVAVAPGGSCRSKQFHH
jgi:hypothetical protein